MSDSDSDSTVRPARKIQPKHAEETSPTPTLAELQRFSIPTLEVLRHFESISDGKPSSKLDRSWLSIQLQPGDYKVILFILNQKNALGQYVFTKVKYDFFASTNKLALRMLSALHEGLLSKVAAQISEQLHKITCEPGPSAIFAWHINDWRSTTIHFSELETSDGSESHDPGTSFYHKQALWPCAVLEISYSGTEKNLQQLAETYILGSAGSIRVVIGIETEYKGSKKATLTIWRPKYVKCRDGSTQLIAEHNSCVYQDKDGKAIPGAALHLRLRDLATTGLLEMYGPLDEEIVISSSTLTGFHREVEFRLENLKDGSGFKEVLNKGAKLGWTKQQLRNDPLAGMEEATW